MSGAIFLGLSGVYSIILMIITCGGHHLMLPGEEDTAYRQGPCATRDTCRRAALHVKAPPTAPVTYLKVAASGD